MLSRKKNAPPPLRPVRINPREALPREIFQYICSFLNEFDMQAMAGVCKRWRPAVLEVIAKRNSCPIKEFVEFVLHNTKDNPELCVKLISVLQEKNDSDFLKNEKIFQILGKMPNLNSLKSLTQDKNFHELFKLACLYRDLHELSDLTYEEADHKRVLIAETFAFRGSLIKAIDVIKLTYENAQERSTLYSRVANILIKKGDIERAADIAHHMEENCLKYFIIIDICKKLLNRGDFKKVVDAVWILSEKDFRKSAFTSICNILIAENKLEHALEFLNHIENEERQFTLFETICSKLLVDTDVDSAIDFANRIPKKRFQDHVLQWIVSVLIQKQDTKRALEFANRLLPF